MEVVMKPFGMKMSDFALAAELKVLKWPGPL